MIFQIFLVVFSLFAIARTIKQHLAQKVSAYWVVVWTLVWLLVMIVAIVPASTTLIANQVGVGRGADLVVYTGLIVMFFTVYRLLVIVEQQRQEITQLTRELSIKKAKKPKLHI